MMRGGGSARKREYDQDSSYRDREDFQSKRARGSYSSRGSYSNTSPRGFRGSSYSSSPRDSSTRGSSFRSESRGSSRSETRGSFRSDSRDSFRSNTKYKTSYESSRGSYRGSDSRGSYRGSDSRGSYRGSDSRGSYRGSSSSRGSYNSDGRGSFRGSSSSRGSYNSDSRGSFRGSSSSRGSYRGSSSFKSDQRRSFGDDKQGSHTSRPISSGSRGRGTSRSFERSPPREVFRSPSSDYRGTKKFSGDQDDFRRSRSPSFSRNFRDTSSRSRFMEEKYHSKDNGFRRGSGGLRGSFKQRFPRERSSRPPYSRGRGSSQYRGRGRSNFERRLRRFRKSPSMGRGYHSSDDIGMNQGARYLRRQRRHSDFRESSYFSDDEKEQEDDKDRYPEFETLTEVKPEEENEAKKNDLAGIILRLLMDEGGHMKVHDLEMELITSKNIQFSTSDDFENFLSLNKDVFKVHTIEVGDMSEVGEKSVTGHSKIMICSQHSKYVGSCNDEKCDALHLCKYRVLSDCARRACVYGHDIHRNAHNKKVLRDHMLHRLSFSQLQQMFRNLYNRQGINIPLICSFYNSETRCRGEYRNSMNFKPCPFLHICKKFVDGTCDELKNCSRSHSLFDKATFKILERYGLNPDDYSGGKREILRFLKNKCQMSTTTQSETHSEHEDISDDEEDDEYKSWNEDDLEEEHIDEEGGDEEINPKDEGEGENEEYDEEHPEGYDEEHPEGYDEEHPEGFDEEHPEGFDEEHADKYHEGQSVKEDSKYEGIDEAEAVSQEEGTLDKTNVVEDSSVADKTTHEQSQSLEENEDAEIKTQENENKQEKEKNGAQMEMGNVEKSSQEENLNKNVENQDQKRTNKLQMVKGNKRKVKQTRRVKQSSVSDSFEERQSPGEDNAGVTMKTLAVWQVSSLSHEDWKGLSDDSIQDLEIKYQEYLEKKTQNILIGDKEYKVDFAKLEGTSEAENKEGIKLKREIPQ